MGQVLANAVLIARLVSARLAVGNCAVRGRLRFKSLTVSTPGALRKGISALTTQQERSKAAIAVPSFWFSRVLSTGLGCSLPDASGCPQLTTQIAYCPKHSPSAMAWPTRSNPQTFLHIAPTSIAGRSRMILYTARVAIMISASCIPAGLPRSATSLPSHSIPPTAVPAICALPASLCHTLASKKSQRGP